MSRIPYTNKVGETLSSIADPAAAYSLRALGGGDPIVARVRRSSDDAEKDFTASDMGAALEDWVNEDVLITNGTFVNISGTYDTFSGASSSGFTATNTASDGRALSNVTISTPQVGDKFRINYNLTLNSGSAILFAFATSTGASSSTGFTVYASGAGSFELTATKTDIASLRVNAVGNVDFVLSDVSITAIQSSGFVTSWYDQSGNDNHATQGTAANQPKIVDGGVLVSDGIKFDGIDDYFSLDTEPNFSAKPCSIFTAQEATTRSILGEDSNRRLHFATSGANFYLSVDQITESYPSVNSTGLGVFSAIHNGTATAPNLQVHANGQASTTTDPDQGSPMAATPIAFVGRNTGNNVTRYFDKSVSEIIIYDTDQSANREAIETNINNYYDIY